MAEPGVYLEKISAFSRMLRLEGLPIGPQETADACKLLTQIGFGDRKTVKVALRTVFAKSREEQLAFDKVFDGFFISEEAMRRQQIAESRGQMEPDTYEAAENSGKHFAKNYKQPEANTNAVEVWQMIEEANEELQRLGGM